MLTSNKKHIRSFTPRCETEVHHLVCVFTLHYVQAKMKPAYSYNIDPLGRHICVNLWTSRVSRGELYYNLHLGLDLSLELPKGKRITK